MAETKTRQTVAATIKRPLLAGALAIGTAMIVAVPAPALADSFLKLGNIKGESTTKGYEGRINILSFSQSFTADSSWQKGGGASVGKPQCGGITVTKNIDRSSPELLRAISTGQAIADGLITFRTEGGKLPMEYYTIKLEAVFLTSITQIDDPDPNRIVEKVVMIAKSFEYEYKQQDPSGKPITPGVKFKIDCTTLTAS